MEQKNDFLKSDEKIQKVNMDISLIYRPDGLTFGTDAYLLSAFLRPKRSRVMVDLGSGTGIISLLCAASKKAERIFALEIQEDFADIIKRNAELNRLDGVITPVLSDVRDFKPGFEVDTVISNPPYMLAGNGKRNQSDAKYIARHEVSGGIFDFCKSAALLLKNGGEFLCVFRPDRMADLFCALRENSLEPKILTFVYPDADSAPSLILVESRKCVGAGLITTPPLIIYKSAGKFSREYTEDMEYIYQNNAFPEKFLPANKK